MSLCSLSDRTNIILFLLDRIQGIPAAYLIYDTINIPGFVKLSQVITINNCVCACMCASLCVYILFIVFTCTCSKKTGSQEVYPWQKTTGSMIKIYKNNSCSQADILMLILFVWDSDIIWCKFYAVLLQKLLKLFNVVFCYVCKY